MGRTNPTATMLIQIEQASWSNFRKALRKEDQDIFDELFTNARKHLPSISFQARPIPLESILLAMLVEQRKYIKKLEEDLKDMR